MSLAEGVAGAPIASPARAGRDRHAEGSAAARGPAGGPASHLPPPARCDEALQGVVGARELFLPFASARWRGSRLRWPSSERRQAKRKASGVRLEAADPADPAPEARVQRDLQGLVRALQDLRNLPGGERLVLARRALGSPRLRGEAGRRARFSLQATAPRRKEAAQAKACHQSIARAVHAAGYEILAPKSFDPQSGFAGLWDYAGRVRLGRRPARWPWLLLLLPLLLLLRCGQSLQETAFGVPLVDEDLFVLVDVSSSMEESFSALKAEVRRIIHSAHDDGRGRAVQLITYDAEARAALEAIGPLTPERKDALLAFTDRFERGGGTRLAAAIDLAAPLIAARNRSTLLLVLTDAKDSSVAGLLAEGLALRARFGAAPLRMVALPPRAFVSEAALEPVDESEQRLAALARALGGGFGRLERQP